MPPNIGFIVDIETDNKTRSLHDLRHVVSKKKGAVVGSTAFYFAKRGRAIFKASDDGGLTLSDLLEEAVEHEGVDDVEELPGGGFMVWTQPASLMVIAEAVTAKLGLEVVECDIVWAPNEDNVIDIDTSDAAENIELLLSGIREYPEVKAIYANVRQGTVKDDEWDMVEKNLDV